MPRQTLISMLPLRDAPLQMGETSRTLLASTMASALVLGAALNPVLEVQVDGTFGFSLKTAYAQTDQNGDDDSSDDDNDDEISGAWYFYDELGNSQWVTFVGELEDGRLETELLAFSGPALGTPYAEELLDSLPVGSATLILEDDDSVRFEFELDDDDGDDDDNHNDNDDYTGSLRLSPFSFR